MNAPVPTPKLPPTSTLDCLVPPPPRDTTWAAAAGRAAALYSQIVADADIEHAPVLALRRLAWTPESGGRAGEYIPHLITLDTLFAQRATDRQIETIFVHELAHSCAIGAQHGPRHQDAERQILERINFHRDHTERVPQLPIQGGAIPHSDWRTWLWLIGWSSCLIVLPVAGLLWVIAR